MRLLIITQAVDLDNPVLGFFHRWIAEFAKHCDSIEVICLREGRHELPQNVHVHSLGKPSFAPPSPNATGGRSKASKGEGSRLASRIKYILNFYRHIWRLRGEYDAVFVHMNPEYVLLAGVWWRLQKKRIVMWYVHRQSSFMLRLAVRIVNAVCTTATESISVSNPKIVITGHGIDISRYTAHAPKRIDTHSPKIVSVGRITPIKGLTVMIEALAHLRADGIDATLDLIGVSTVESDCVYEDMLHELISSLRLGPYVSFLGSVNNTEMPEIYPRYDISFNASPTGGIDKTVLESMASGVPVFVANIAFRSYLEDLAPDLMFAYDDADDLTRKVRTFLGRTDVAVVQEKLRTRARQKADLALLITVILGLLK